MKTPRLLFRLAFILFLSGLPAAAQSTTAFTYQGFLRDTGFSANGSYDLRFTLYTNVSTGNPVGSPVTFSSLLLTNGVFTVSLDFGNVFNGTAYWLDIGVRPGGSGGGFSDLAPRQYLSPSPYAQYAPSAGASVTAISANTATLASNAIFATTAANAVTAPYINHSQ